MTPRNRIHAQTRYIDHNVIVCSWITIYSVSKKSGPSVYSQYTIKHGQDFLDILYRWGWRKNSLVAENICSSSAKIKLRATTYNNAAIDFFEQNGTLCAWAKISPHQQSLQSPTIWTYINLCIYDTYQIPVFKEVLASFFLPSQVTMY